MRYLAANQLMALMEAGNGRSDIDRSQLLLAWYYPARSWESLASTPMGERDRLLLVMRNTLFGDDIRLSCRCPNCNAPFEFDTATTELLSVVTDGPGESSVCVHLDDAKITVRPLGPRDMMAIPNDMAADDAARLMAQRAIIAVCGKDGKKRDIPTPSRLKKKWQTAISSALEEVDPLSAVAFRLSCADCMHGWRAFFDIGRLLWRELESENAAVLDEIHVLASHYGWREADIVAIPPVRRRAYARMLAERADD